MADFAVPSILFVLFAVFSSLGAYFLAAHFRGNRGRMGGIIAALLTLLFFVALFLGLLALMPAGSLSPG